MPFFKYQKVDKNTKQNKSLVVPEISIGTKFGLKHSLRNVDIFVNV
jgi:hypothetical protein